MKGDPNVFTPTINNSNETVNETMEELARIRKIENPYESMREQAKFLDKNQNAVEKISPSLFSELLNDVSKEALRMKEILNQTEVEPKLLFDLGFELTKRRGLIQAVMNSYSPVDKELDAIRGHEFQDYLAQIGNQYFQMWLAERGIEEGYSLSVQNRSSYPSNFMVKKDGSEIYRFSLKDKWYGTMRKHLDPEAIVKKNQIEIDQLNEWIKEAEKEIEIWESRKAKPLKHYRGLKNIFAYLRMRPKFRNEQFQAIIDKKTRFKESLFEKIATVHRNQEFEFAHHEEMAKENELIRPFFEELGYTFNEERNSMY